jgi:pantetheine-phosphate adenylyltransferase
MTEHDYRTAVYPGSFDPITRGHEDIIRRALRICDRVVVGVAHRATHMKRGLFDIDDRVAMIREVFQDEDRVTATAFEGAPHRARPARGFRFRI